MARELPWTTVDELIALLKVERDLLDAQIAAMQASQDVDEPTARLAFLLARYAVEGSADRAAKTADELGWRIATTNRGKPSSRSWRGEDLLDALKNPPPELPPGVVALVRRVYGLGKQSVVKQWG